MTTKPSNTASAYIEKNGTVTYYEGEKFKLGSLDELQDLSETGGRKIIFAIPFRAITERGSEYMAHGDEGILAIEVYTEITRTRDEVLSVLRRSELNLESPPSPSVSDVGFALSVKSVQEEIAAGEVCQAIISRRFEGKIQNMSPEIPEEIYARFLSQRGQYMTVLMKDEYGHALVSASPERHLEISGGKVIMNPIAGTMPKGDKSTFQERLYAFLEDEKEIGELYQVLDEELKMMAAICPKGGRIEGPFIRETGAVIHTEYLLVGENGIEPVKALRNTLHAPTLVGGPLASASRQIHKYETGSRRYYGGEVGVLSPDGSLDSAIMIRGAEIFPDGRFAVQAGAGIVKNSVPEKETAETTAKAEGALRILTGQAKVTEGYMETLDKNDLRERLAKRNRNLSRFHMESQSGNEKIESLKGKKVTIVNNEDDFALMLAHMASHMGCDVKVVGTFGFDPSKDDSDIVILGPGPGDINDASDKRMSLLLNHTDSLRKSEKPVLGICLGHQALAKANGMEVVRQQTPTQGVQREVNLFGRNEKLGFYNSFTASGEVSDAEICRDESGNVTAMRGSKMSGFQFHPESVMSQNGYPILAAELIRLLS